MSLVRFGKDRLQLTVTSARAHCGTCVPCGTGFGKLLANYAVNASASKPLWKPETHVPGAEIFVQLVAHSGQLLADDKDGYKKRHDKAYSIQNADWQAPHALTREYTTVLHLHMLSPPAMVGPEYESPDRSGSMVNAAGDEMAWPWAYTEKEDSHPPPHVDSK